MFEKIRLTVNRLEEKKLRDNLTTAIRHNDLRKVQFILGKRDSHGNLKVNLNGHFRPKYDRWLDNPEPIFSWLFSPETTDKVKRTAKDGREINLQVVFALLDAKDANGQCVIDLTKQDDYGSTDFSKLLWRATDDSFKIESSFRIELLKKLFENPEIIAERHVSLIRTLRSMILYLSSRNFEDEWPILEQLLKLSANSNINLNEVFSPNENFPSGYTLLDLILKEKKRYRDLKEKRPICEKFMRELGCLRANEIPEDKKAIKKVINEELAIQQQFEKDTQGTHDSGVMASIAGSLLKLKGQYSLGEEEIKIYLKQIEIFLKQLPDNDPHKTHAIQCFNRIKGNTEPFPKAEVSLRDTLVLIWQGILDKNSIPEKNAHPARYIHLRKQSFLEKLSEAETIYPERDKGRQFACPVGTLNKLVEALNHAHCDVEIVSTSSVRQVASEEAIPFALKLLESKSLDEQKAIWMNWDEAEGAANDFRKYAATEYEKHLKLVYDHLLTDQQRQDILVNFDELPLKHLATKELEVLVEKIKTITEKEEQNPFRQNSIARLKAQLDNVFLTEDFSDRYLKIKGFYSEYVKREKFNDYLNAKQEEIIEKNKSILYKFYTIWAGMFAPKQNATRKLEIGMQVMENLNSGRTYDDGLDENAKETAQTGNFGIALKCK